jgi:hypothetical protein
MLAPSMSPSAQAISSSSDRISNPRIIRRIRRSDSLVNSMLNFIVAASI